MAEYTFTKSGVYKTAALEQTLKTTGPKYDSFTYQDSTVTVYTTSELTEPEVETYSAILEVYEDPEFFLTLNTTMTDSGMSHSTNSLVPEPIETFIYTNTNQYGDAVFNAIKTILEYTTEDVQAFLNASGSYSVHFEIRCYTRDITLESFDIDITDIVMGWKTMAENAVTGKQTVYRTFLIEGLRHKVASYDCLWNYYVAVSDANIFVTAHGRQMLYYDIS
jgi:hypothetical protein